MAQITLDDKTMEQLQVIADDLHVLPGEAIERLCRLYRGFERVWAMEQPLPPPEEYMV